MRHFLAYLDPGSGSIIIQVIMGGVLGMGYMARKSIAAVLGRFRRKDKTKGGEKKEAKE
ncbi:hypothetical protein IT414_01285 [bacterium]|nr:hypothetical protein [bacterium]